MYSPMSAHHVWCGSHYYVHIPPCQSSSRANSKPDFLGCSAYAIVPGVATDLLSWKKKWARCFESHTAERSSREEDFSRCIQFRLSAHALACLDNFEYSQPCFPGRLYYPCVVFPVCIVSAAIGFDVGGDVVSGAVL